jgi:glycosidase
LRTSEAAVRELVCDVGRFWVRDFGIDGWRLDVANEVDHALWRAFKAAVRAANPDTYLVGEIWEWALPWLRGDQFDATMNYPVRNAIIRFASGGRVASPLDGGLDGEGFLNAVDRVRAAYPEPIHDLLYNLLGSHDEVRPLTALEGDRRALALAAGLLFTLPGIASVYYGDEVGLDGGKDPANRAGMEWDPARQDQSLLRLFRRLGALRRKKPALRNGPYERLGSKGDVAAFARGAGRTRLVVLANSGRKSASVALSDVGDWVGGNWSVMESFAYESKAEAINRSGRVSLPARSLTLIRSSGS